MKDYRAHLVITVAEAAEWLRTSEEAILKLAEEGRIPAVRYTADDPPVFRPEDIVAFVEQQSGSREPSGLFGAARLFAPLDARGVPMPPVPPVPPVPPTPSVFAFSAVPGETAYEYSFAHDTAASALERERDALEAEVERRTLAEEVDQLREELRRLSEKRER